MNVKYVDGNLIMFYCYYKFLECKIVFFIVYRKTIIIVINCYYF